MDYFTWCIITAGFGMGFGALTTSIAQGLAVKTALEGVSRNPAASGKILTTMLIGVAMIESLAIYVFVIAMIILFVNPFTQYIVAAAVL